MLISDDFKSKKKKNNHLGCKQQNNCVLFELVIPISYYLCTLIRILVSLTSISIKVLVNIVW